MNKKFQDNDEVNRKSNEKLLFKFCCEENECKYLRNNYESFL